MGEITKTKMNGITLLFREATNTHDYERPAGSTYETWTYIGRNPDWVQLEQKWSDANSAGSIN